MRLDAKAFRYLTTDDWRVLTAVEIGSKNHYIVPTPLIISIAGLRHGKGGTLNCISNLARLGLIGRVKNAKYDGYRLTYGGLDYLSLHSHCKSGTVVGVGSRFGVGKESDIYIATCRNFRQTRAIGDDESDMPTNLTDKRVVKIHRLGRISFRKVKKSRDYLRGRNTTSWMYMSQLAAQKEFTFMQALYDNNFPVPRPYSRNRHSIVMSLIDGIPLRQVPPSAVSDVPGLYSTLISIIVRLAEYGLIHGDFNEFNIMLERPQGKCQDIQPPEVLTHTEEFSNTNVDYDDSDTELDTDGETDVETDTNVYVEDDFEFTRPVIIDFPQMVSIDHVNAEEYFNRDVESIKRFFKRRFRFTSEISGPTLNQVIESVRNCKPTSPRLDGLLAASGFSKKMSKDLEKALNHTEPKTDVVSDHSEPDPP